MVLSLFVFVPKQAWSLTGTNFLISQIRHHLLYGRCPFPSCCEISLTVTHRSTLMIASTFCSLLLSMDHSVIIRRRAYSVLKFVVSALWHCWHPCRRLRTHDEVTPRCLQLSCSLDKVKRCHWQPFYHSVVWENARSVFILVWIDVTTDTGSYITKINLHVLRAVHDGSPTDFPTFCSPFS